VKSGAWSKILLVRPRVGENGARSVTGTFCQRGFLELSTAGILLFVTYVPLCLNWPGTIKTTTCLRPDWSKFEKFVFQ